VLDTARPATENWLQCKALVPRLALWDEDEERGIRRIVL